jgi:D-glycero-D-manno-heptose 1,7-bisphosphate phosphatase
MDADTPEPPLGRAVFLDRDGVLVDDPGYLSDPDAVRLLPGAARSLVALRAAGWRLVVVTNQSGFARGHFTEERLAGIHARLGELLAAGGATLDAIYYCPHHPDGSAGAYRRACDCRKPLPGLLLAAARDLRLDLAACWMVGDQPKDVAAGRAAGCRTILIGGEGAAVKSARPDYRAASLLDAAALILNGYPRRANHQSPIRNSPTKTR